MSFSFGFCVDDDSAPNSQDEKVSTVPASESAENKQKYLPARKVAFDHLLSYSPVHIPHTPRPVWIVRRDLFDVRFQIISGDGHCADALSDLIPGVYEGGLKTWECSLDLVTELDKAWSDAAQLNAKWPDGKHFVELGCGTAIPSCYVLDRLFTSDPSSNTITLTLCDYNEEVLSLVRVFYLYQVAYPNLLLAWYFSAAGKAALCHTNSASEPGDLEIDTALVTEFEKALSNYHIDLRFFCGSWDTLDLGMRADLVLSSETVYNPFSLPPLCRVLHALCWPTSKEASRAGVDSHTTLCLIASKVLYFGVGGGIDAFVHELDKHGAWHHVRHAQTSGIGRVIMQMGWSS